LLIIVFLLIIKDFFSLWAVSRFSPGSRLQGLCEPKADGGVGILMIISATSRNFTCLGLKSVKGPSDLPFEKRPLLHNDGNGEALHSWDIPLTKCSPAVLGVAGM
jgi:hypothetical protein